MASRIVRALVAGACLVGSGSVVAAQEFGATRVEVRAFHFCLYTAWVQDYCGKHTFLIPDFGQSYRECVIANKARLTEPIEASYWGASFLVRDACWARVRGERR